VVDGDRVRYWGARIIAPLAFFAAVTLLVLLVQNSLEDDGKATSPAAPPPAIVETAAAETTPAAKKFYRVALGDTLESIAKRFDTTVPDLLTLNPELDPLALRPGERIRVQ
jgi:LysM repeat protein